MRVELDAYLEGARDHGELLRLARVFDAADLPDVGGLDALVWRSLRGLAPLDAARVLLNALGRLHGDVGADLRDGAAVLEGLPGTWTHDRARAALHADRFDGWLDVPDDAAGPSLVLGYVIDGAYREPAAIVRAEDDRGRPGGDRRAPPSSGRSPAVEPGQGSEWPIGRPGAEDVGNDEGAAVAEMAHRVTAELAGMLDAAGLLAFALDLRSAPNRPEMDQRLVPRNA